MIALLRVLVIFLFSPSLLSAHPSNNMDDMISWAVANGAFVHPLVEYRDGGMFAKADLEKGLIITKVPVHLVFGLKKGGGYDICERVKAIASYREDPESFWYPYFSNIPTTCQSLGCYDLESLSDVLTVRGTMEAKDVVCKDDNMNLSSSIFARYFSEGLIPIMDLFNHLSQSPSQSLDHYMDSEGNLAGFVFSLSRAHVAGEEIYNEYGDIGPYELYRQYGIHPSLQVWNKGVYGKKQIMEPCFDQVRLRLGDSRHRVECIASQGSNTSAEIMVNEIKKGYDVGDLGMVKGAALWIDRNMVFVPEGEGEGEGETIVHGV